MSYRGVVKELKDIAPGTPVELVEGKDKFAYKGNPEGAVIGILTSYGQHYGEKDSLMPRLTMETVNGFEIAQPSVPLLPTTKIKELTGPKAELLLRNVRAHIDTAFDRYLTKTPSFSVGTDPEIFVVDGHGDVIPAPMYVGDKKHRIGHEPFWDGFQAEFTVPTAQCACFMFDDVRLGLERVWKAARKYDPKAKLSIASVVDTNPELMDKMAEEHVILGCSPSRNAYDMAGEPVSDGRMLPWRFAGGHIHLGHTMRSKIVTEAMVKAVDCMAVLPLVGVFEGMDTPIRRKFYGLAGEYRLPNHGLELRSLSNAWLCHPAVASFTFDLVRTAAWMGASGLRWMWDVEEADVVRIINECDVQAARAVVEKNAHVFLKMVEWFYTKAVVASGNKVNPKTCAEAALQMVMKGVKSVVKDVEDLEGNWLLGKTTTQYGYASTKGKNTEAVWAGHTESLNRQWHKAAEEIVKGERV